MSSILCEYCDSSDRDTCKHPYLAHVDTTCASVEKRINELTDKMIGNMKVRITEYSQCFHQSRENCNDSDSSLGSLKSGVTLFDDFEPSYLARPNLNEDMPLPSQEQESGLPIPLSRDLAPHSSSPKHLIEDILISANPPTTLHDSFEFKEGYECGNPTELDLSVITDEHHDLDESDLCSYESCEKVIEPTNFQFDDDIFSVEYESISCGFDVNVGLDVDLCAEYESFSFEPIQIDLLFGNCKSEFVKSESIANKTFAVDQTYKRIGLNRLVPFAHTILPRLIVHDNPISRPMTH